MLVQVSHPDPLDQGIILNLGVYFRYELLPFIETGPGSKLNAFGTIADDGAATHEQGIAEQAVWWTKPGVLLPMLIRVDGEPAGFAQVARPPHAQRSVDYRMEDFFVVNQFRRAGVGRMAVAEIVNRHPGWWEVGWVARNKPAEAFWRAVTSVWKPEDWSVEQGTGTAALPGIRFWVAAG